MNNTSIYRPAILAKTSRLQRLLHQQPQQNAVIEVNNLLAEKPILSIGKGDITAIEQRYALTLHTEFPLNMEEFYAVYLNYCLNEKPNEKPNGKHNDNHLTTADQQALQHLRSILSLDPKSIANLHTRIGGAAYQQAFVAAISGGRLTPEAAAALADLAAALQLPTQLTEKISSQIRQSYMQQYLRKLLDKQRVSPDEEKELAAISENFQLPLPDDKTQKRLQLYRRYWDLQHLPLPPIIPDISLPKTEECYFMAGAIGWFELRSVRYKSISTDEMTKIDSGSIYLTSKRIIFNGAGKNNNIALEKIQWAKLNSNGVEINKGTAKNPEFRFADRADIFYMMLDRLLREKQ